METITCSQIQDMVSHLPPSKLAAAYSFLKELLGQEHSAATPEQDFIQLPLGERRRVMLEQANKLRAHYAVSEREREAWQAGDFVGGD